MLAEPLIFCWTKSIECWIVCLWKIFMAVKNVLFNRGNVYDAHPYREDFSFTVKSLLFFFLVFHRYAGDMSHQINPEYFICEKFNKTRYKLTGSWFSHQSTNGKTIKHMDCTTVSLGHFGLFIFHDEHYKKNRNTPSINICKTFFIFVYRGSTKYS